MSEELELFRKTTPDKHETPEITTGEVISWPKTQFEYWKELANAGAIVHFFRHEVFHENMSATPELLEDIQRAESMTHLLLNELKETFGVIPPWEQKLDKEGKIINAPEGKIHFFDWYRDQNKQFKKDEYSSFLCSECPFAIPLEEYLELPYNSLIPCREHFVSTGPFLPGQCIEVTFSSPIDEYSKHKLGRLVERIEKEAGISAAGRFLNKWHESNQ